MSDIRFNSWLHRSGTGGVYQDSSGRVGIGTSVGMNCLVNSGPNALTFGTGTTPAERLRIESGGRVNIVGICSAAGGLHVGTAATIYANGNITAGIVTASNFVGDGSGLTGVASTDNVVSTTLSVSGIVTAIGGLYVGTAASVFANGNITAGIVTATAFVPTSQGQLSHRNLLVNGAMTVSQRATTSTSTSYQTVDRAKPYWASHNAGTVTQSQSDVASGNDCYNAGFRKAYKIAISQAGNTNSAACYIGHYKQRIEAQDIAQSGWRHWDPNSKLTLSFWIKSTTADTFQLQCYVDDNTKKKYNTPVTATTSWTKIIKTIPGHADININNDTGEGFSVALVVASGSDLTGSVTQNTWVANSTAAIAASNVSTWLTAGAGNVETTGWQLEVGSAATPFEHRGYGEELARCQRYFFKMVGSPYGARGLANEGYFNMYWPTTMRANPTLVYSMSNASNGTYLSGKTTGIDGYFSDDWSGATPTLDSLTAASEL